MIPSKAKLGLARSSGLCKSCPPQEAGDLSAVLLDCAIDWYARINVSTWLECLWYGSMSEAVRPHVPGKAYLAERFAESGHELF